MVQTGVRSFGVRGDPASMAVDERISLLRSRMQSISKSGDFSLDSNRKAKDKSIIPLSDPLSRALPWGGMPRGMIIESTIAPLLAILFIAQVSGSGGRVGVVGWPDLNYAGVLGYGGCYERIFAVPQQERASLRVVTALAHGCDLVITRAGPTPRTYTPLQTQRFRNSLRSDAGCVIMMGDHVVSPAARLTSAVVGYHGIGKGTGRIKAVEITVTGMAKGFYQTSRVIVGKHIASVAEKTTMKVV